MRALPVLLIVAFLGACSSSTEPSKAGDPSILVTNDLPSDWVYITWKDGLGIVGRDSVAPRTASQCVRFLAQPDSAYWEATTVENGYSATVTSAEWFNPADAPAWSIHVFDGGNPAVPAILQSLTDIPC